MKKKEYLIGDVASMIGVSRDTLRFYEKKGILAARKKENGYRYYSEDDIFELSSIFYHRKMNIGLEEIENLWNGNISFETSLEIANQQINAEKAAIEKHQLALTRLRLFQEECKKAAENLNHISLKPFPRAYIMETQDSPQACMISWFYQARKEQGLDMLYTYDAYTLGGDKTGKSLTFQNSSLLMYEDLAGQLNPQPDLEQYPRTECKDCLYTIVESHSRIPGAEVIASMMQWAGEHGQNAGDQVLSTYIMHGMQDGEFTYYLEIYIPLAA